MRKRSKRYREMFAKVDQERVYTPLEAIRLVKELASAKFDETVEVAMKLGVDPRKADQMVRGTVSLPNGTGKEVRVLVFAQGDKAREAEEAGADVVGAAELAEKIQGGWFEFDAAIATPDMMSNVGKLGKLLGPRGLMPNPKLGTVTFDVGKAVSDIKKGRIEYRVDRQANMHLPLGKASFDETKLVENYSAVLEEINRAKPASAKGKYIKSMTFTCSMGPAIKVDSSITRDLMTE